MKAVVLAGGYATRLWPITKHRPKMFLPVGEATVIDHILRELEIEDRIEMVYVSTNERFGAEFSTYLRDSEFEKPQLSIERSSAEREKFGVVGALTRLVEREDIEDDMIVIGGDNLFSFDIADFIDAFEMWAAPTIAAYDVGTPENATPYGVLELDDRCVVGFSEKPDDPTSSLVSVACYGFPRETLSLLDCYLAEGNNPDEPGWFVQWLQERKSTHAYTFDGAWFDIGTQESYLEALAWQLDGESYVAESATLENVTIGDDVYVMDDTTLVDSTIERTVVFPGTTIESATVRRSIVDTDARIVDLSIHDGLIGAHTQLSNRQGRP